MASTDVSTRWRLHAHGFQLAISLAENAWHTQNGAQDVIAQIALDSELGPQLDPQRKDSLREEATSEADVARLAHALGHAAG